MPVTFVPHQPHPSTYNSTLPRITKLDQIPTTKTDNTTIPFFQLPPELHFQIGSHLSASSLRSLTNTSALASHLYNPLLLQKLTTSLELHYRKLEHAEHCTQETAYTVSWIPRLITSRGLPWLKAFTAAWGHEERGRWWEHVWNENKTEMSWEVDEKAPGRWHWQGKGELERRRERIGNWVWVQLVFGVLGMLESKVEPRGDKGSKGGKGLKGNKGLKESKGNNFTRGWKEEEGLEMLRFLMREWMPKVGEGIFEYEMGDGFNSWVSCEMCSGYPDYNYYDPELFGRKGAKEVERYLRESESEDTIESEEDAGHEDEDGAILGRTECWYEKIMEKVIELQHVGVTNILMRLGGLEWKAWRTRWYFKESPNKSSMIDLLKYLRVNCKRGAPEFLEYFEREVRTEELLEKIELLLRPRKK